MLEERPVTVVEVRPFQIHGVPHVDVTFRDDAGRVEVARLGAESVPADLAPGERVVARLVMASPVAIERLASGEERSS